jgi:hypothetical protein
VRAPLILLGAFVCVLQTASAADVVDKNDAEIGAASTGPNYDRRGFAEVGATLQSGDKKLWLPYP